MELYEAWLVPKQKINKRKGEVGGVVIEKVSIQTNLKRNLPNSFYIFLLDMNFENLTTGLYVLIIFSIFAKFQKGQRSIPIQ